MEPYATDLTNSQWELIEPLLPASNRRGRPRTLDRRQIVNAIFYLLRTGCQWRLLPRDMPSWSTVYVFYRRWRLDGTWLKRYAPWCDTRAGAILVPAQPSST